nr:hypothetical protein [Acidobacteriota bacterium]
SELVRAIFRAAKAMGPRLTRDHKLLIAQYLLTYGKVTKQTVTEIEKEQNVGYPAETVTEYFENIEKRAEKIGEKRGEIRGEKRGEKRGEIQGALKLLNELRDQGILSEEIYETQSAPLRRELQRLQG